VADPPLLSRRAMLLGAAATGFLAACGGGDSGGDAAPSTSLPDRNLIMFLPPQGALAVGSEQRLPMGLADAEGVPLVDVPAELDFTVRADGASEGTTYATPSHAEGLSAAYFPVRFTPEAPGIYEIGATVDGQALTPRPFEVAGETTIPSPGQPLPPVDTPTPAAPLGVDPICTREPVCPFHEVTLTDALGEERPVAFLVATPEFCQTAVCGPVLDLLVDAAGEVPDVRMLHCEVYANPRDVTDITQAELTPAMEAYGMSFEPCLWVTDASGTIQARLDTIYDRAELLEVLRSVS
jgi:hypothetical protein